MSADLLTTVLREAGMARRLLDLSALADEHAIRFPCERSIGLHVVLRGPVHLHATGLPEPLALDSGDIAVMARGCDHVLSQRAQLEGQAVERIDARASAPAELAMETHALPHRSSVLSGAYQLWHTPLHPFFAEMPAWSVLRAADLPRLGPLALTSGLLAEEKGGTAPGADIVVQGLLDVVFTYALRQLIQRNASERAGWSQALHDPLIGRVVARMHEAPEHPWTLELLARDAGLSRTALAERFRTAMGDTPLNHLRGLRMQRAMQLLSGTSHHLEAVATAVGYQDAFTFSKVFKRTVGVSPKVFRQGDAADRQNPFRFQAG